MKRIIFTVTNDLNYDQRMKRICTSLSQAGYAVELIGYTLKRSIPLFTEPYKQKRINCLFKKGKLFYAEYNVRLFFYLLFKKADCICAIDLDTSLPCYLISKIKNIKNVMDAHEFFTELDEVIRRPFVYKVWRWVEKKMIPRYKNGYTVCQGLADEFKKIYGVDYGVIRNIPVWHPLIPVIQNEKFILYQGYVNHGRGLDKLIEAMQWINMSLVICGDGNFMNEVKKAAAAFNVEDKIKFMGMLQPDRLREATATAYIAINPFDNKGLNQYLSLSNKFFDYIHAGVPQVTMNYPEYQRINDEYNIAILINNLDPKTIADGLNNLIENDVLHKELKANCNKAKVVLNWQQEEKKLLDFYNSLLS